MPLHLLGTNITTASSDGNSVPADFPFVIDCGAYTGNLVQMLNKAVAAVIPAISDSGHGSSSPYGFQAMFKDGRTSVFVQSVLRSIASAYKLEGLLPHPRVPSAPHFACVNTDTIRRYRFLDSDPYELCTMPGAPGQAFYVMGTSYIFLCPSFWRGQVEPQRDKNICPSVTNNRFLDGGETLAGYASYLLIHEMVHFYLQAASLGIYTHPPEIYPINYCVGLDAMNSIRNPQNYQFYVAMVHQRCTDAPDPYMPPFRQVQLNYTPPATLMTAAWPQSTTPPPKADLADWPLPAAGLPAAILDGLDTNG